MGGFERELSALQAHGPMAHEIRRQMRAVPALVQEHRRAWRLLDRLGLLEQLREFVTATGAGVSEERRLNALRSIAERHPRPIHPRRWGEVSRALTERAAIRDTTVEDELCELVLSGVALSLGDVKQALQQCQEDAGSEEAEGLSWGECRELLRKGIGRSIEEGALEPGWRRRTEGRDLSLGELEAVAEGASQEDLLLSLEVATALVEPLPRRQKDLCFELMKGAESLAEAGEAIGVSKNTARAMAFQIRKRRRS